MKRYISLAYVVVAVNVFCADTPWLFSRAQWSKQGEVPTLQMTAFDLDREVTAACELGQIRRLTIPLPLTAGPDHALVFDRISLKKRGQTTTWRGLCQDRDARLLLTMGSDYFFGRIVIDQRKFLIEGNPETGQVLRMEMDGNYRVPFIGCAVYPDDEQERLFGKGVAKACLADNRIDVMVLYTNGMGDRHGQGIDIRIQFLIDVANDAYSQSEIDLELNLVYRQEVTYPDDSPTDPNSANDSDMQLALRDLTFGRSVFENVAQLRDEYGADQVTLLRRFVDEGCGLAWVLTNSMEGAFAVVHDGSSRGSFCSDLTYCHEVGHNQGCNHDRDNTDFAGRFSYSYGWQEPTGLFHTVMAYRRGCGSPCVEIDKFSSPLLTHADEPTGVAEGSPDAADNRRTIEETKAIMAANRVELLGSTLPNKYVLPEVWMGTQMDTALGVLNSGSSSATIEVTLFSSDGHELGRQAPSMIPAGHKTWTRINQMFPNAGNGAWVQLGSSQPLQVIGEFQADGVRSAYWASEGLAYSVYVPHVAKNTAQFETVIAAVNGGNVLAESEIVPEPFGDAVLLGNMECSFAHASNTASNYFGFDIELIDWATMSSNWESLAAMEYFTYLPERDRTAALGLNGSQSDHLRFLHVAADVGQFWTGLVYINVGPTTLTATETYYGEGGVVLAQEDVNLIRGAKRTLLFDDASAQPEGTLWVDVIGDRAELVGYELFGSANQSQHRFFAGLSADDASGSTLIYPHLEMQSGQWTGIVALNLGSVSGSIVFEGFSSGGQMLGSTQLDGIVPNQKVVRLVSDLFDSGVLSQLSWVKATTSSSTWNGFVLWGDLSDPRRELSGIVAKIAD